MDNERLLSESMGNLPRYTATISEFDETFRADRAYQADHFGTKLSRFLCILAKI